MLVWSLHRVILIMPLHSQLLRTQVRVSMRAAAVNYFGEENIYSGLWRHCVCVAAIVVVVVDVELDDDDGGGSVAERNCERSS